MANIGKPTHKHDCKACKFLAAFRIRDERWDGYVCTGVDKSLVLRKSSDGPDYASRPVSMQARFAGYGPAQWSDTGEFAYSEEDAMFMLLHKLAVDLVSREALEA